MVTKRSKKLRGGSALNSELRRLRRQHENNSAMAASAPANNYVVVPSNVPSYKPTLSRSQKIKSGIYSALSSFSKPRSSSRAKSIPVQPVSTGMSQNNREMVRRMTARLEDFKNSQNITQKMMNAISKQSKRGVSKQTHVYPYNLAVEILKSNPVDIALFHRYCQQSLDNWRQFKLNNGGVANVKRMRDNDLKTRMKSQVVMLSNITHLRMMQKITKTHAPEHFLLKMLNYLLSGNDGGGKVKFEQDIDYQQIDNDIPDAASHRLISPYNIPDAANHTPVSKTPVSKTPVSQRNSVAVPMGGGKRTRKAKRNRKNRKARKTNGKK